MNVKCVHQLWRIIVSMSKKSGVKLSPEQRAGFLEEQDVDTEEIESKSGGFPRFAIIGAALVLVIFLWLINRAMSGGNDVSMLICLHQQRQQL